MLIVVVGLELCFEVVGGFFFCIIVWIEANVNDCRCPATFS
jgi:hypothetical protein